MSSNRERLALVENSIGCRLTSIETTNYKIESLLGWLKWIGGAVITIGLFLVANLFID